MGKIDKISINSTEYEIVPEIAPLFDPSDSYSTGDCVIHNAVLYKFTANHTGAWTGNDVTAFEVGRELVRLGSGSAGSGLTEDIKVALLACFEKVAWIDEDGQDYYDALYDALYPPTDLVSISAVFTQGSAVIYDTDSLDTLKQYLVVTAHMSDSSTQTVTSYTLSGTLTEGTSTITVSYSGKTTTFNVTVSVREIIVYNGKGTSGTNIVDNANRALSEKIYVSGIESISVQNPDISNFLFAIKEADSDTTVDSSTYSILPASYIGTNNALGSYGAWTVTTEKLYWVENTNNKWRLHTPSTDYIRLLFRKDNSGASPITNIDGAQIYINDIKYKIVEKSASEF